MEFGSYASEQAEVGLSNRGSVDRDQSPSGQAKVGLMELGPCAFEEVDVEEIGLCACARAELDLEELRACPFEYTGPCAFGPVGGSLGELDSVSSGCRPVAYG